MVQDGRPAGGPSTAAVPSLDRDTMLRRLASERFDLLVVGGGITGCGVAWQAATRGLRVALVERADFGSGTSSRSTKLIHGGLRYLREREIALVRESVREREHLLRAAPHLVQPLSFVFPVYRGDPDPLWKLRLGLALYERFAGRARRTRLEIHGPDKLLRVEPLLPRAGLRGGAVYGDSATDDARLVMAVLRAAIAAGAVAANYTAVTEIARDQHGRSERVIVQDAIGGGQLDLRAATVLNAAGPWADEVRALADPDERPLLRLTKGVHIALPHERLPVRQAAVLRAADQRIVFAVPSGGYTYVGTTDTDHRGPIDTARVERDDVRYLLETVRRRFEGVEVGTADLTSAWVGLRPLVTSGRADPSRISRGYELFRGSSGVVTVAGGKLTAFRAMAAHIVDELFPRARRVPAPPRVAEPLPGAPTGHEAPFDASQIAARVGLAVAEVERSLERYGSEAPTVLAELSRIEGDPAEAWWVAQLRHAVRHEMAVRLEDVLARRTRALLFTPDNGIAHLERLGSEMGELLGWSAARLASEIARYRETVAAMWHWRESDRAGSG